MLHSCVSSDVLNQGWGSLPSSTVFVNQTSSVSSLAPCLVTGSSIRCPRRCKKPHRTRVRLSKFRLPFFNCLKTPTDSSVATPAASPEGQGSPVGCLSHPPVLCRHLGDPGASQIVLQNLLESVGICLRTD